MISIAAILLGLAALGGLLLAVLSLQNKSLPWVVTIVHGLVAATGLVLVLLGVLNGEGGAMGRIALGLLTVAALGGFFLLSFHVRDAKAPPAVIVIHALVAVSGFGTLLGAIFS